MLPPPPLFPGLLGPLEAAVGGLAGGGGVREGGLRPSDPEGVKSPGKEGRGYEGERVPSDWPGACPLEASIPVPVSAGGPC